ncbi:MAG: hypothetical protein GWP08_04115 [Nitrospiraceae bacterium]|nr:hypothetical protein [Nitrospiraceae bacterium]
MSLMLRLKRLVEHLPRPVGGLIAHVPYAWRLGPVYTGARREIARFATLDAAARKEEAFRHFSRAVKRAWALNEFYRTFCEARGFSPDQLNGFGDIERAPVITKADLRAVDLADRSGYAPGRILTNTGGSSGEPLHFYLDRHAFAREWAHMHAIWDSVGYRPTELKLTFRGRNLGHCPLKYNAVYHEYLVNAYSPPEAQAEAVMEIAGEVGIIHGYPSAIYEFVRHCAAENRAVLDRLRKGLKAILFASEYPAPLYRDPVEAELGVPSVSWYGHSEMAVLAYEVERYVYAPFPSYGHCEAVPDDAGNYHLVGTSYENHVSPFIRYDTEDLIAPEFEDGLLARFRLESGRVGEYIEDAHGNRVSLTALIFGRHHAIFSRAAFIQVRQREPGVATIVVTLPTTDRVTLGELRAGFDGANTAIEFDFEVRNAPERSPNGKVPLLLK